MGSGQSKKVESQILRLPLDVWNHSLCHYLTAACYAKLSACGDSRLGQRLNNLAPDSLTTNWPRHYGMMPLLAKLMERTGLHLSTELSPRADAINVASRTQSLHVRFESSLKVFNFSSCPNLRILHLTDVGSRSEPNDYDLLKLIEVLPPTMVELVTAHKPPYDDGPALSIRRLHLVPLSAAINKYLPMIETLCIPTVSSSLPSDDQQCAWPESITKLAVVVSLDTSDQQVEINLPPLLTSLSLSSSSDRRAGVINASSLPPSLTHLGARQFKFDCDAPFPPRLASLACQRLMPDTVPPFPFPRSLTRLEPIPSPIYFQQYPAALQILTCIHRNDACVGPLSDDDVQEWETYEQGQFDLVRIAKAFAKPDTFDLGGSMFVTDIVPPYLFPRLASRLGATVKRLLRVKSAWMVVPLMSSCKWLEEVRFTSVAASSAFLQYTIDIRKLGYGKQYKVPHLVQTIELDLSDSRPLVLLTTALREDNLHCISSVSRLVITMDAARLVDGNLCLALGRMFPNVSSLYLHQMTGDSRNVTSLTPSHLNILLMSMARLSKFELRACFSTLQLSHLSNEFVSRLSEHVASIKVEVTNHGTGTRGRPFE